tara:strand:- start:6474 stop:7586 length:1113 start_codon:yes stop_codon:yes gene_type:complete
LNLLLIFTFDVSLQSWDESGLLSRETYPYKVLYEKYGISTTFLTFGNNNDLMFKEKLEHIEIIPIYENIKYSKSKLIRIIKSIFFCFKYKAKFHNIDLIKTNQLSGGWVGLVLRILLSKPLILRTGFDKVVFLLKEKKSKLKVIIYYLLTQISLSLSNYYIVSSASDKNFLDKYYLFFKNKIIVNPNWVENTPLKTWNERCEKAILMVGRLENQKNYQKVIKDFSNSDFEFDIVGSGSLKDEVLNLSLRNNTKIELLGNLQNDYLLKKYSDYKFFLSTSLFEGNSKVILEAMGAGCVVFAVNNLNNREIITNGINGFLFEPTDNLLNLFENLNENLLNEISNNAVATIKNKFSIETVLNNEMRLINSLIQ